jgi:deoxyribonuclease V
MNNGPQRHHVVPAALWQLERWVKTGQAAPTAPAPKLSADKPTKLATDANGLAEGGVRTLSMDVPTALLTGAGSMVGVGKPFDRATRKRRYPGGKSQRLKKFEASLDAAIKAGFILPEGRTEIMALAALAYPPNSKGQPGRRTSPPRNPMEGRRSAPEAIIAGDSLIVCVDVDYRGRGAVAAGVWFRGWSAATSDFESAILVDEVADYEPGAFYRRELPCLHAVLATGPRPDVVVVDGYVWLANGVAGLGGRLHAETNLTVVGVAKTRFRGAASAVSVCRGISQSPLHVTAAGVPVAEAAAWVAAMHGPHRMPTLLRRVDSLARTAYPGLMPDRPGT